VSLIALLALVAVAWAVLAIPLAMLIGRASSRNQKQVRTSPEHRGGHLIKH
jgi:hypothetical protein